MMPVSSLTGRWWFGVLALVAPSLGGLNIIVANGYMDGRFVGNFTSQIAVAVLPMFPPVTTTDWSGEALINSSTLRYLHLSGDYFCDTPLLLPSLLILELDGTMRPASNLSTANIPRFTGMVTLNGTTYSGVIGGTFDASSMPAVNGSRGFQAIAIAGGGHNVVRSVRAVANNSDTAIGINESPYTEVANCDIGGTDTALSKGRCIWTLATSHAIIHHNHVHHCSAHALDFDAYTSTSTAYSNLCEDNTEEGIFVEETASGNFVFNNTLRRNGCGIGLYSNAVGPVQNNMIIGNVVDSNLGDGITSGGMGHAAGKYALNNIFASNFITNNVGHNGGQVDVAHGKVIGDVWVDNTFQGAGPDWAQVPTGPLANKNVSIFVP